MYVDDMNSECCNKVLSHVRQVALSTHQERLLTHFERQEQQEKTCASKENTMT
jgi:hypothetical protein